MQLESDRNTLGARDLPVYLTAAPAPVPTVTSLLTASLFLAWLLGVHANAGRITADPYVRYLPEATSDSGTS